MTGRKARHEMMPRNGKSDAIQAKRAFSIPSFLNSPPVGLRQKKLLRRRLSCAGAAVLCDEEKIT